MGKQENPECKRICVFCKDVYCVKHRTGRLIIETERPITAPAGVIAKTPIEECPWKEDKDFPEE